MRRHSRHPAPGHEKEKPAFFAKTLYKGRARIEQAVGKLKRFKRIALRCEKTKRTFASYDLHEILAFREDDKGDCCEF